ncbi:hypothetical protein TeGR_g175 [Tetraparma gracilis]|uniref:Uncharacterized protein n=1 Tax=Tetraparma gracilis TaxID=2962635 RepID=A0ABQ6M5W5_9STRA|nr:hypothetical protein TeGR_g175 [Tetraparma gracilis]
MDIYSCELFAYKPESLPWDPYQIHADAEKGVVYVGDHDYTKVHAFYFDGAYLGRVEETEGNLGAPSDFTIYEGAYPPLSTFELPDSDVSEAGTDITVPLTLKNHRNLPIGSEFPASPDIYSIEATGLIPGTNYSSTITGSIGYDRAAPSSSALTASLKIPFIGDWTISLTGGNSNPQSFFGSPTSVTIFPASTDPASCTTTFPTVITAGSDFTATVSTFDAFLNPTSHAGNTFKFALDDGRLSSSVTRTDASASVDFSDIMTRAGSYKLEVTFDDKEVAGSPLYFEVLAAAPHALSSLHNIDFATLESRNTAKVPLELRVAPFDRFNNTLPTATGYAVSINDDAPTPLLPPSFSHTHQIPAGYSGSLRLSFTLDGVPIANSPVTISVSPDWTLAYVGAAMCVLLLVGLACFCWQRVQMKKQRKLERVERQNELKLSMDEKLVKDITTKVQKQNAYYTLEAGDVLSDIAKPVYVALTLKPGREWLLALVVVVGLLALVQAYISIPVRRKMLKHYRGIIEGDMLHIYAEAEYGKKKDGEQTVGKDNLKLKLDSVTLELTMEELNETTVLIESVPALIVFVIEIVVFPKELSWVSAVSGLISGVMLGRKTSGGTKKAELKAEKRELEEELEKLAGGKPTVRGSMMAVESVFGARKARALEEEVLETVEEGDVEMARLETRPAEPPLPGQVGEEVEEEDLRVQLEGLRRRNVELERRLQEKH